MRSIMVSGAGLALLVATGAAAQMTGHGPGAPYPMPGRAPMPPRSPMAGPVVHPMPPAPIRHSTRWGSQVGGRWWGGVNAPGGWNAYRRPVRGYRMPVYWNAPRFFIADYGFYGLPAPQSGYNWVRYYDDAVLLDGQGSVYDMRGGLDWDRGVGGGGYVVDERRSDGTTGAVAGAIVGGVAGNVIAGRGNRLGGTLIGAGVGAAAGYGIDRATGRGSSRDRGEYRYEGGEPPMAPDGPPPGYDDRDVVMDTDARGGDRRDRRVIVRRVGPGHGGMGPHGPGPGSWTSADGRTTVTTVTSGSAPVIVAPPAAYGYGYGPTVTTITVQSAPVVTTTTTETIEDVVTYSRPAVHRRTTWRPRTKVKMRPRCRC